MHYCLFMIGDGKSKGFYLLQVTLTFILLAAVSVGGGPSVENSLNASEKCRTESFVGLKYFLL